MPRIRTIKPGFFQSDDVSALPLRARLTWIGLWTQCDDAGRTKDHPRLIKAAIWPLDNVSLADIEEDLNTLDSQGRIVRYEVDGERYLEITNWSEHQKINRATTSRIPPPTAALNGTKPRPTAAVDMSNQRPLTETSRSAHSGKGKEGKGREGTRAREPTVTLVTLVTEPDSEPPLKCDKHAKIRNPPSCGDCADARRAHARWEAERNRRIAAAPKCRLHRGEPRDNCGLCRSEELSPP